LLHVRSVKRRFGMKLILLRLDSTPQTRNGRTSSQSRLRQRQFTLTAMVRCGHCGCLMVGELKKGRYVYYHCTGNRGPRGDPYIREEQLVAELARSLKQMEIAPAGNELQLRLVLNERDTWNSWMVSSDNSVLLAPRNSSLFARAVRYALNQWNVLTRFLED